MLGSDEDSRFGYYFQMSQIGVEMVAPIALGIYADSHLGTTPWLLILGTVLGFGGGLAHLVYMARNAPKDDEPSAGPKS